MQDSQLKEEFNKELIRFNAGRTYLIASIGVAFGLLLLVMDVLRWQSGKFETYSIYWVFLLTHWLLIALAFPAWRLRAHRKTIQKNQYEQVSNLINFCLLLAWLSLIPMSLAGVLTRGSSMPFGIFIFIANLFCVFPAPKRLWINLSAFIFMAIGILSLQLEHVETIAHLLEILGFIIPTFFIASNQYRLKEDTFVNKRLLEEKNESIQAANADLMMQALQAQMNPHFIFNTLNSIQHFFLVNDQQSSLTYLSRFARLIRLIFQYSKARWIKLEEEIEFLRLYLQLEELRFENKIVTNFEVDERLEELAHDWVVPPLLIQPLIENAFKHGLMHLETKGRLDIHFRQEGTCLRCTIEDNGVGREKAQAYDDWRIEEHRSSALEIIRQRLATFNAISGNGTNQEKLNRLELTDLLDEDGKAKGTRIELIICLLAHKTLYERTRAGEQLTLGTLTEQNDPDV